MTDKSILAATPFAGEAFLVSWSESSKGRKVTFELSADSEVHPFKDFKHGTRFMLAATKIGDDEQPARVKSPAVIGAQAEPAQQPKRPFKQLQRSQQAALKCQDNDFYGWLTYHPAFNDVARTAPNGCSNQEMADLVIKHILKIPSKAWLDLYPGKAAEWDALLTDYDTRGYTR